MRKIAVGRVFSLVLSLSVPACDQVREPVNIDDLIDPEPSPRRYSNQVLRAMRQGGDRPPRSFHEVKVMTRGGPESRSLSITLDRDEQRIRLDVPADFEYGFEAESPTPIHPSFAGQVDPRFVPASALGFKAKQFDDGLYAAVEAAATAGLGRCPGKTEWLSRLLQSVVESDEGSAGAASLVLAALRLGGESVEADAAVDAAAYRVSREFLAQPLRAKPLGFYTWNRELAQVFQRDRLLQGELDPSTAEVLARAIASDAALQSDYEASLRLAARLTNPSSVPDLRAVIYGGASAGLQGRSLLPASRSVETDLGKKLYGNAPIPDHFDLSEELIARVRDGRLDLRPTDESGWYDHQTWALEPLVRPEVMPEARHLEATSGYRKELVGLFKGLLALTRETHVKQLEVALLGAAAPDPERVVEVVELRPNLTVEPLASYYLRRARAYRHVREVLVEAFGEDALQEMRRLTAGGPVNLPLADELQFMEQLFQGAYVTACGEIGLPPESPPGAAQALFEGWAQTIVEDPDLGQDLRMMVPVFHDVQREQTKVWAVLGVATRSLSAGFAKPPAIVKITDESGRAVDAEDVQVLFAAESHPLAYLVTVETYVSKLLDRQEFRRLCDEHRTFSAIVDALR